MRDERDIKQLLAFVKLLTLIMIGVLVAEMGSCMRAHAAVITGEKHLAGGSYWIEQYVKATGHSPYTEDIELLAEVMYHENFCNGQEAMELTGSVVINRVKHPEYPDSIKSVLYERGQYSTTGKFFTRELPKVCYDIALDLIIGGSKAPDAVVYQAMFRQGSRIYKKINTDYFCYE